MKIKEYYDIYRTKASTKNKEEEAVKMLINEYFKFDNIYLHYDEIISEADKNELDKQMSLYLDEDKPVQYILGYSYFYGLKLSVNPFVLIPRFDTEVLVETALDLIKKHFENKEIDMVDIGCGSGAISIAIMKNAPTKINCDAIDISPEALEVSKQNCLSHGLNINYIENDLLNGMDKKYDLIVSNPPYIDKDDFVANDVLKYEPHLALFANDKGMYFYQQIIKQSFKNLKKDGIIIFEIGYNQHQLMEDLVKKYYPNSINYLVSDYANNPRVYVIINKE